VALLRTDVLGVTYHLHHQDVSTGMMKTIRSSETSVFTGATRRNIPEGDILHSPRREILKSYITLSGWALQRRRNVSPVTYVLGF
jgi:hypothetical protein